MTRTGKILGLAAASVMLLFSSWLYLRSGDWVAAVFAAGSLAWGVFFYSRDVAK